LQRNGYETIRGNQLELLKQVVSSQNGADINVGTILRSSVLAIFDFRAFLNVAMLLSASSQHRAEQHLA